MPHDIMNLPSGKNDKPAGTGANSNNAGQQQQPPQQPPQPDAPQDEFHRIADSEYMKALVGGGYMGMRERWEKMYRKAGHINKMGSQISFNWPSMIFPLFWTAYRGVWPLFWITSAAFFCVGVIELLNNSQNFLVTLAVSVICGLFGDAFYFSKMRKKVAFYAQQNARPEQAAADNSGRGSIICMLIGFVMYVVVVATGLLIAEKTLQNMGYNVSLQRTFMQRTSNHDQQPQGGYQQYNGGVY